MYRVCRSTGTVVGVGEHVNDFKGEIQLTEVLEIRKPATSVFIHTAGLDKLTASTASFHLLASLERYLSPSQPSFSVVPQT